MHQKLAEKIEKLDVEPALRNKLKDLISIMDDSTDGSSDNKNQILAKANIATFDTLRKQLPFEVHLDKNFNVSWANKGFIKIIDPYYEKMESERLGNFTSSGKKDLISKEFEELPVHSLFLLPEPLQLNLSSLHEITFNSVWFLKTPEGYRLVFKKQEDTPLFNQWTISPDNTRFIICEIDIHGTLKRCNSTFNLKFGLDQGMGESTHLKEWLNPLYIHRFETILSRVIYENESASLNICFKDDDPESSNAYSCTLIPDVEARRVMFIAFHSHLTERDDENLYMDEHLYRSLADNLPDMNVFLFNREYKYLLVAGRDMKTQGFQRNHFEGRSLNEVYNPEIRTKMKPIYDAALEGRFISKEIELNNQVYLFESSSLKNKEGRIYAGMVIAANITKEKETEEKLKLARDAAENASRTKSEFLANMSHEIRTPLNAIIGFSEQLEKTSMDEKQKKFTHLINESSNHLLSIVNEILILFKLEAGKVYIEKDFFKLPNLIEEIYNLFKIRADKKKIEFSYTISEDVQHILYGDVFRIRQILFNLLSNAIKFTDYGSVKLTVNHESDSDGQYWVSFTIQDTGIGMDEDELKLIFSEFSQADASITRKYGGSGLGLAICKKLIDLQNGRIKVESTKNVGTIFKTVLPLKVGDVSDLTEERAYLSVDKSLLADIKKVLLVDDDETNRFLGQTILENWGIENEMAVDGEDAIHKLTKEKFDLLLLDIHMPKVSGIDVTKYIRSQRDNPNRDIKIIAITANIVRGDVIRYMSAGMDNYIIKPFREQELFNKICHVFQIHAVPDESLKIEEEKLVLRDIKSTSKPYSLDELVNVAKGDPKFFNKMIISFISNIESGLEKIKSAEKTENWNDVGEAAHKLISSCRFFQLDPMAESLRNIENNTLTEKNPEQAIKYIRKFEKLENEIIPQLRNEIIEEEE